MTMFDDDIWAIVSDIWDEKHKAATYAEIYRAFKKKFPGTTKRGSSIERKARDMAAKGKILKAEIKGQVLFAPTYAKEFQLSTWARGELK